MVNAENISPFIISGLDRRQKKKELFKLKYFVKMFWFYEDIDRFYGGGLEEEEIEKILAKAKIDIEELEKLLSEKIK